MRSPTPTVLEDPVLDKPPTFFAENSNSYSKIILKALEISKEKLCPTTYISSSAGPSKSGNTPQQP